MKRPLLKEYAFRHNAGVRSGDFSALLEILHSDAEMHFIGIPAGPFLGRAAIARAFREGGPGDELILGDVTASAAEQQASYGWRARPEHIEGRISILVRDQAIASIVIRRGPAASAEAERP